ncbi:NAD-dependent epimerase [Enterococcus casseliflavus]|uniref:NAD-dependent epimerase n=1 Tax=Enterococcus casseliflavus TaxID=37734 RepID=UPI001D15E656|nr:NAD-dependent epimerase [Enterococcus casseliflavus]
MKKVLVTGAAGFIGYSLIDYMMKTNEYYIVGIDNMNDYYDVQLKHDRLSRLKKYFNFNFIEMDIRQVVELNNLFKNERFDYVINLAAQAGVRYSLENPKAYIDSNVSGFMNILEACRSFSIKHLIYASSSSVYGGNQKIPFSTEDNVDHPVSLYAATKKTNELMAHTYSHLYNLPTTGLRFFTVYGPYGRPDMAYFSFTKNILEDKEIQIYNNGNMMRDFTYIDDITKAISNLISHIPQSNEQWKNNELTSESWAPYKIYNIGNNSPVKLIDFIEKIEFYLDKKAKKNFVGMQKGDVTQTFADISDLAKDINFQPQTNIDEGICNFVKWFKDYYKK